MILDDLTKKQKGFVKDYVETGNGTQAALNNYDIGGKHGTDNPEKVASVIAAENLAKPSIQNAIKSIAEQIPDDELIKVHKEGLQADKKVFKNNNATGEIEEVASEPDFAVRYKYLDSAYKLKGSYAPDKSVHLNLNGDIMETPELQDLASKLNAITRNNTRDGLSSNGADASVVDSETQG